MRQRTMRFTMRIALGLGLTGLFAVVSLFAGASAYASVYGRGAYSTCGFQVCSTPTPTPTATPTPPASPTPSPTPTPPPSTVITTPSGLDFAVNLANGQIIQIGTYSITITPLNGHGTSFSRAEIYIDGALAFSGPPAETGTLTWNWEVTQPSRKTVKVVVYTADGAVQTKEFSVVVVKSETPATAQDQKPSQEQTAASTGLLSVLPQPVAKGIVRAVKQIPVPVAVGFPYLLFALLGVVLLILVLIIRREVARIEALRSALARERLIAEDKTTFLQLVAHYLRTPLTLLQTAFQLPNLQKDVSPPVMQSLTATTQSLQGKVNGLLDRLNTDNLLSGIHEPDVSASGFRGWASPAFIAPLTVLSVIALLFNYLVVHVGQISANAVNFIAQVAVFGLLAFGLYQVLRERHLRGLEHAQATHSMEHQIGLDQARNAFITDAMAILGPELEQLNQAATPLPDSQATKLIRESLDRYQHLMNSFAVVGRLESAKVQAPFTPVQLHDLVAQAESQVSKASASKAASFQDPADMPLAVQTPDWLVFVLRSLLDNAIAYSPERATVTIGAEAHPDKTASIEVTDQGGGIPPDKLARLFQPFYKAEGALTFNHEGAGLSLYLDKLVMNYLGGSIRAQSQPGRGTTFTLTFPIA